MDNRANPELAEAFTAALDWWREAGVDRTFHDESADWITPPAAAPEAKSGPSSAMPAENSRGAPSPTAASTPAAAQTPSAAPPPITGPIIDTDSLPDDLASFSEWWLNEPLLDDGRVNNRIAPRGEKGAELMVIIPDPEQEDRETLLSGPQGKLLNAMLDAMGIAPASIYFASALPRHTPMADWAALAQSGIGNVLAHHVKLVAPKRLITLGGNILPLLGNNSPNSSDPLRQFNHKGLSIPHMAVTDLTVLLARKRAKAKFWQLWLNWTKIGTT